MISRGQMAIYARFGGDIDGLTRVGTAAERALMAGGVWATVDRLRDGMARVRTDVAAPEYAALVAADVARELADPVARDILERLVEADVEYRKPAG